jgi:hypothetical protein
MTAPSKLGRYEIVRPIGKSMTDVYLAIDTVENRKAALKLIRPDGGSVSRLVMEAERRGAAIQKELGGLDPRMVQIYDFGDLDGYFFVAMQYVEGRTLAEVLESDSVIDANRAAVIALEICEQLAKFHAGQAAVVHGDIKPSNIHLGPNDTVRLLDFGIAKTLRANGDATAHHFGSPGYCAPERLTHSQVDQQSDLWALGATLYEMLTGVPPYRAQDTHKLENLIRSKRPPRALPASCPRGLGAIVMKTLAPDPARRYAGAAEMQADLQAFLERRPTMAERERRAAPWSAGATLLAAREALRKATRTLVRARRTLKLAGALAWFLVGMALSIGGTKAWWAWHPREAARRTEAVKAAAKRAPAWPGPEGAPPAPRPSAPQPEQPGLYTAEAETIIGAYRRSADPALDDFDWYKAEIYLERAVALGDASARTEGELALAKGYATLERLAAGSYSEAAAAQLRGEARADFSIATEKMPDQADPHLAMARLYVYALPDVAKAMREFAAAERLGARLGSREIEQQGDAYRMRAEREAGRQPAHAWNDAHKAKALYETIRGFDQADADLKELARIHYGRAGRARKAPTAPRERRWQ